jgi:hypothetical protein
MNGLSFHAPHAAAASMQFGRLLQVRLSLADQPMYEGEGRIARLESAGRGLRVGVQLMTGFLDLPAIRRADDERTLKLKLGAGAMRLREKVPAPFRDANEQGSFFIAHHRRLLDEAESRYREEGANGRELIDRLGRTAIEAMRPRWREVSDQASGVARAYVGDADVTQAMKSYVETTVTTQLLDVPLVHRAYTKPLGYPGDFQVMNMILRNAFEGRTVFSRVMNKLFAEEPIAEGGRARLDAITELHRSELAHRASFDSQTPFRVLSLGCGPAREVCDLSDSSGPWPVPIEWTLMDQDERVLSLAYGEAFKRLSKRRDGSAVRCLYMSFQQMMNDPGGTLAGESHDFVYASGLYDYLPAGRARALTRALYDKARPGGLVMVANAAAPSPSLWPTEYILDWTLIYRNREEMLALAADCHGAESVEFMQEPVGAFSFILIRKPR